MNYKKLDQLIEPFGQPFTTIDSHTAGEPTRLIIDGIPNIPGETMQDKRFYFQQNLDHIRKRLTREPCGHLGMFTAAVTKPVSPGAQFGLIYMDSRRYPFLCGHGTIGAVTTLIDIGQIQLNDGKSIITVDTPSGPLKVNVQTKNNRTESVTLNMVPSFVHKTDQVITLLNSTKITTELVCVGGFFVMVNARQLEFELIPENSTALIELGMSIIDLANRQLSVEHPERPEVKTVDVVEFYENQADQAGHYKSIVIYGESHMDRSPCGTGTTAKMTLLHHLGQLQIGEDYISAGPLGTTFTGRLVVETTIGTQEGVIAQITGNAHITGFHRFIVDNRDPFPEGYLI